MTKDENMKLPKLEDGYVYADFANKGFVISGTRHDGKAIELFRVSGPQYVAVPIDPDVQAEAVAKYSTTLDTLDGDVELDGWNGIVATKWMGEYESVRGGFAALGKEALKAGKALPTITEERFQNGLLQYRPYTGTRRGFQKPKVETKKVADLSGQDLLDYLEAQGIELT